MSRDSSTGTIVPETEGSPDEQDAAPEDQLEAFKDIEYEDNDVKESRHPDTPINDHNDLTRREKVAFMGLLAGYNDMHKDRPADGSRSRLYREFFRLIFRDWTSEDGNGAPPEWRERSFHDRSLKVGALRENHPEPNTTRRRVNQPIYDDEPVPPPLITETSTIAPKSKYRVIGQPIYLSLTLDLEQGWYSWFWGDLGRQFVNPKYITFSPGLDRDKARNHVISHYDRRKKARITAWNREVVIFLARRRIVKWARDGSTGFRYVEANDRLRPEVIQELVWAHEFIQQESASIHGSTHSLPRLRRIRDF
ncbi:hypothetical protein FSOLCH5_003915 [Fusarium solani]